MRLLGLSFINKTRPIMYLMWHYGWFTSGLGSKHWMQLYRVKRRIGIQWGSKSGGGWLICFMNFGPGDNKLPEPPSTTSQKDVAA